MKTIKIRTWKHFEKTLQDIYLTSKNLEKQTNSYVSPPLFRGQSNAKWSLETTLDRIKKNYSAKKYYQDIRRIKPVIESCTSNRWKLEEINKCLKDIEEYDKIPMSFYRFMTYLRHNGFPSPLLDWTRSPYIAAFFALNDAQGTTPALYMFMEWAGKGKEWSSDNAKICSMGKYVTTHKRHHIQQCEYTFCIQEINAKHVYASHESVLSTDNTKQDILKKYTLPYSKRLEFLYKLNQMNINSYSLFENEEGLMNKLSNEEFLIKNL